MIDCLKPYPAMKDSGVTWLGEVPEHWCVKRGKALFRPIDVRSSTGTEELLTVSSERGVVLRSSAAVTMFKAESYVGYKLCWPSDLVINSLWAWSCGLGVSRYHGIVSSAYGVYRLRPGFEGYSHYIDQLVRSSPFQWELQVRSKGIWISRLQLTDELFLGAPFPVPPEPEQAAIVRFLDHADRRIRRYIRAKQKLIKLLEEQKQAIIHQAVTRGLDPTVRLKPSGVEWLGDVPAHWAVVSLGRFLTLIEQGWSPVAAEGEIVNEQWAVLTLSSVRRGVFDPAAIKPISQDATVPTRIQVRNGDFLLTRSNARDRVGDVCVVENVREKTILCDLIYRLRVRHEVLDPRFLMFQLLAPLGRGQIERDARGSSGTMPKISQGHIKSWRIVVPPIDEQRILVASIVAHTNSDNTAIIQAQREISLLREYRTRLIADVVTGKLDVREAAAKLPDEPEDMAVLGTAEELEGAEDASEAASDDETVEAVA